MWSGIRVGIDQFFGFGPRVPFVTNEVFTNREREIRRLHERLAEHSEQSWPVERLLEFQRAASNIVTVAGEGGIGKSTLARHVADLAVKGKLHSLPENRAHAIVDFADPASSSFETIMLRVRAALGRLGRSWPAFDVALAVYWERKHPGESLTAFLSKGSTADTRQMAEQVGGTIDQLLGGFGAVSAAYQVVNRLGRTAAHKARLKRLRNELPALDPILNEEDPDRMLGYMPVLLAADLEKIRARKPTLALCVLDTLENVQLLPSERGGLEDLVSRLVYLMPNVMFIAASRLPLRWHDQFKSVGLTYGGEHRWPGLAGPDQLGLEGFDRASAEAYLKSRVTMDGRPAIEAPFREKMIAGSGGSPLYLDLSAGLYEQYLARGETPPLDAFGQGFPELVLRTMRDLSEQDRDLLRAAALLEAFDTEMLCAMLPELRRRRVEDFITRPFVRHDESVWPPFRLHENLRRSVLECDAYTSDGWTTTERHQHLQRAIEHLAQVALAVWDERPDHSLSMAERSQRTVTAFLLTLRSAYEHSLLPAALAEMAYSLSVLGHWQVLSSLPELGDSPELARLSAVARLTARGDLNSHDRYHAMRELVADQTTEDSTSPFADYYRYELGTRAHISGHLEEAIQYLSSIAPDGSLIGAGALFGLADNALRRSDYREVLDLMDKASNASLDRIRVADMLGHTYLHNARFAEAAALFESSLDEARTTNAPLWEARALRHLTLALMWYDPDRALRLVPRARDLNSAVGELIGLAQCDVAASMAHAFKGDHHQAAQLLGEATRRFTELGATRELLPVEAIQVLQYAATGQTSEAADLASRLAEASDRGEPQCLPAWLPVTALWAGLADSADFSTVRWLDSPETTRQRWLQPLLRLQRRFGVCGHLDVDDLNALIPTDRIDPDDIALSISAALTSDAYDGPPTPPAGALDGTGVLGGLHTVIKPQRRQHERLETVLRLERIRTATGIRAPRLLDHGTVETSSGPLWWAVLERLPGRHSTHPTPEQQRQLGRQLRLWHSYPPDGGLRLDDPGALGVLLGWARRTVPRAYPAIAERLSDACTGMPMSAIHGDLAVCHNALFDGDRLTGVLDPGAIECGPPMLDLAWALAVDLPRGGTPAALFDGYGSDDVDREALNALLPLMLLRRLIDTPGLGIWQTDGQWIIHWLQVSRPDLLALVADELDL